MVNTSLEKKEQKKITYCMDGYEPESDFVFVGKNNRKYYEDIKAITWESPHRLMIADISQRK